MAQTPQRPYVPHRTPTRGQPAISVADFALAKPFIPGAEQLQSSILDMHAAPETTLAEAPIASIATFLAAPQLTAIIPPREGVLADDEAEELQELPPLEHFLDPLPPISEFSIAADTYAAEDFPDEMADVQPHDRADSDWVATDWQRYDWQSVAALGDAERSQAEAASDWAMTDWDVPSPRKTDRTKTPADAIAVALDQIAERLRNGDLGLPGGGSVADPATIAATLAALLGVRR
ncbi:MAG: hypothetical protein ACJ8AK_09305 [Gemmatimonadaceae bacterium]